MPEKRTWDQRLGTPSPERTWDQRLEKEPGIRDWGTPGQDLELDRTSNRTRGYPPRKDMGPEARN